MPTAEARPTVTADSVDFVDKDDAGSVLFSLLEKIADAACAHADKHFYEIRAKNREEWKISLACDGPCKESFACPRRPNQQHAFRDSSAKLLKLLGFA